MLVHKAEIMMTVPHQGEVITPTIVYGTRSREAAVVAATNKYWARWGMARVRLNA